MGGDWDVGGDILSDQPCSGAETLMGQSPRRLDA